MTEPRVYGWTAFCTALILYFCSGWYMNVNHHVFDWFNFVVIVGVILLCCIFGVWAHHVIEKPCAKLLKKIWK